MRQNDGNNSIDIRKGSRCSRNGPKSEIKVRVAILKLDSCKLRVPLCLFQVSFGNASNSEVHPHNE